MAGKNDEKERSLLLKGMRGVFLVFDTTHTTMKAEALLKSEGIAFRLFPRPQSVVSGCGILVKVLQEDRAKAERVCRAAGLTISEILILP